MCPRDDTSSEQVDDRRIPGLSPDESMVGQRQDSPSSGSGSGDEDLARFFSRHLVSLGCIYERRNDTGEWTEKKFFISAFAFLLRGVWHLATAGHVLEEIEQFLVDPATRNPRFVLCDVFGPDARHISFVPFDYPNSLRWTIHDEVGGADFGVIAFDPNTERLLSANGVVPVAEVNWKLQKDRDYLGYMIVGLPNELMELEKPEVATLQPLIFFLEKVDVTPEPLKNHTYPMFYGRIGSPLPIQSIKGMSGSPILGFVQNDAGRTVYYVVAVQSGWLVPGREVIYGTKFKFLAESFEAHVDASLEMIELDPEHES